MRKSLISIALLSAVAAVPAVAQTPANGPTIEGRVNKLEKEMKAVQRKVFPTGAPVQPDIAPADTTGATAAPATSPIADLTARVDALEGQLRTLTGQVETNSNRLRRLEDAYQTLSNGMDARLKALEPQVAPTIVEMPAPSSVDTIPANPPSSRPVVIPLVPQQQTTARPRPAPTAAPAGPVPNTSGLSPEKRKALVDAIEIPATGDAGEDAYTYAFRLWQASFYPEAQAKLKEFAVKYPRHKRLSFAQNLLGRAYLDEGKPALASVAFYDNYTKNPRGERASDSLYYLGVALTRLKKFPDACKVYDEFRDVYGTSATADLQSRVAKGRIDAKCS
ncbi:MAG: tetratricopeptide repeat protein [Chakrabartia sp.]